MLHNVFKKKDNKIVFSANDGTKIQIRDPMILYPYDLGLCTSLSCR